MQNGSVQQERSCIKDFQEHFCYNRKACFLLNIQWIKLSYKDKERINVQDIKMGGAWYRITLVYWIQNFRVVEDRKKITCERFTIKSNSIQAAKMATDFFCEYLRAPVQIRRLCTSGTRKKYHVKFILSPKIEFYFLTKNLRKDECYIMLNLEDEIKIYPFNKIAKCHKLQTVNKGSKYTVLPFRGHPSPVPHHLPIDITEFTHSFDLNAYFITGNNDFCIYNLI